MERVPKNTLLRCTLNEIRDCSQEIILPIEKVKYAFFKMTNLLFKNYVTLYHKKRIFSSYIYF